MTCNDPTMTVMGADCSKVEHAQVMLVPLQVICEDRGIATLGGGHGTQLQLEVQPTRQLLSLNLKRTGSRSAQGFCCLPNADLPSPDVQPLMT